MFCDQYRNLYRYKYHTPLEWRQRGEQEIAAAEEQQELAQRLTLEADRLVAKAKDSIVQNKQEIDHQSKVKVKDVEFKCNEIERQKRDVEDEIDLLLGYRTRIEDANKFLVGDGIKIIDEILNIRKCRQGIDLVFDDVEKELLREREFIFGVNEQLEDLLDKVVLQIRKMRTFVYNLTIDSNRKKNTLSIEMHNEQLNENSIQLSVMNSKKKFVPATITVSEWDQYTLDIMSEANKALVAGRPIRAYFEKCLSKIIDDLTAQANAVDKAFALRVEEYHEVIEKFKKQKTETVKKIDEVKATVDKLRKSIDEKEVYIALVYTRLSNRTRREGVELCRDELEVQLYKEASELEDSVLNLQRMMADSTACLRHLKQSLVRIDIQLGIKEDSLHVDGRLCVDIRKRINYRAF